MSLPPSALVGYMENYSRLFGQRLPIGRGRRELVERRLNALLLPRQATDNEPYRVPGNSRDLGTQMVVYVEQDASGSPNWKFRFISIQTWIKAAVDPAESKRPELDELG
jgi:hypothetical protein